MYNLFCAGMRVPVKINVIHVAKITDPLSSNQIKQAVVVVSGSQMAHTDGEVLQQLIVIQRGLVDCFPFGKSR